MSLQQGQTRSVEHLAVHNPSMTSLHGRWLFIARMGWIGLTLLVVTLNTIAIPHYYALAHMVCQPGASCIFGFTYVQLRQLRQLDLSPEFLTVYQIGWDVGTTLIYTTLAALIF